MANKMLRFCLTLTLALALPAFAQTGPAQPKSVRPTEPIALGTEYMTWSTGVSYTYDGSGNIRSIGSDSYVYDAAGRLVQSDLTGTRSNFGYDAFGNRISCTQGAGNCQYSAIDTTTNRLSSATYETGGSGNVASFWGHTYAYDAVNMATRDLTALSTREFVYTADDERLAVYTVGGGAWNWTVRDAGGKVLREFTSQNPASGPVGSGSWTWSKDYVWRDGSLLASRQTDSVSGSITTDHYHLDHLGTPRRITDEQNRIVGIHDYYAFGPEDPHGTNESPMTRLKFTGHERDLTGSGTGPGTLDYMHARYYDPAVGRFLSPDPTWDSADSSKPQSWNRYAYVRNNPANSVDPDGREPTRAQAGTLAQFVQVVQKIEAENPHATPREVLQKAAAYISWHADDNGNVRYIYTTGGGWIDQKHFFSAANSAVSRGEVRTNLLGIGLELSQIGTSSFFSYEDVGSNQAGADFGDDVFYPDGSPLSSQATTYLNDLGATDPENAPNYHRLPETPKGGAGSSGGPGQSGQNVTTTQVPCTGGGEKPCPP